jgi:hypothetical protein
MHRFKHSGPEPPLHLQQAKHVSVSVHTWHQFVAIALDVGTASVTPMKRATNRNLRDFFIVISLIRAATALAAGPGFVLLPQASAFA